MSDCTGKPCDHIVWSASDAVAEVWQDHLPGPGGTVRRYSMPQESDPLYGLLQFPRMRTAFDAKAQEVMKALSIVGRRCDEGCRCVLSDFFIYTDDRVSLSLDYDAGSDVTWKIFGSYRLEIWRYPGTCYPIYKKYSQLLPLDDAVYALMETMVADEYHKKT